MRTRVEPIDHAEMLALLGGDEDLRLDVVRLFLEDCPRRLAAIESAVKQRDVEGLKAAAHALKGAAGQICASRLFEASAMLEQAGAEGRFDTFAIGVARVSNEAALVLDALRRLDSSVSANR